MKLTRRMDFEEFIRNIPTTFTAVANRSEVIIVEKEGKRLNWNQLRQRLRLLLTYGLTMIPSRPKQHSTPVWGHSRMSMSRSC
jgi:hypothetical protein